MSLQGSTCSLIGLTNLHVTDYFSMYSSVFVHVIYSLTGTYQYPILLKILAYSKPSSQIIII